jgi:hypothetical protein
MAEATCPDSPGAEAADCISRRDAGYPSRSCRGPVIRTTREQATQARYQHQ